MEQAKDGDVVLVDGIDVGGHFFFATVRGYF
jgi:hypothetical protein